MPREDCLIAYFCGTSDRVINGRCYHIIELQNKKGFDLLSYDGCDSVGRPLALYGINAHGTGEIAQKFIHDLKQKITKIANSNQKLKIFMEGHSRGCVSIAKALLLINKDPNLRNQVDVVVHMNDPVSGNLESTVSMGSEQVGIVSHKIADLSQCNFVKKSYVTFLTHARVWQQSFMGFNIIYPKFSFNTETEVEVLPDDHLMENRESYSLQCLKSKHIILEHFNKDNIYETEINDLIFDELCEYKKLKEEAFFNFGLLNNTRSISLENSKARRDIHFGGKIAVYNDYQELARNNKKDYCLNLRDYKLTLKRNEKLRYGCNKGTKQFNFDTLELFNLKQKERIANLPFKIMLGVCCPPNNVSNMQKLELYPKALGYIELIRNNPIVKNLDENLKNINSMVLQSSMVAHQSELINELAGEAYKSYLATGKSQQENDSFNLGVLTSYKQLENLHDLINGGLTLDKLTTFKTRSIANGFTVSGWRKTALDVTDSVTKYLGIQVPIWVKGIFLKEKELQIEKLYKCGMSSLNVTRN